MEGARLDRQLLAASGRAGFGITPELGVAGGFGFELKPRIGVTVDGQAERGN